MQERVHTLGFSGRQIPAALHIALQWPYYDSHEHIPHRNCEAHPQYRRACTEHAWLSQLDLCQLL